MSDKNKGKSAAAVEEKPASQVSVPVEDEADSVPDERDQAELEAARQADSQRPVAAAEETVAEPEPEPEPEVPESVEVVALRQAVQAFQDKIDWHAKQVEEKEAEIANHHEQIEQLKDTLRTKFSGLVGQVGDGGSARPAQRPQAKKPQQQSQVKKSGGNGGGNGGGAGSRQRTNYGDGNSTGDLIAACLKRSKKPVNTEQLVGFLKQHGNTTNPSVELSRMVAKGLVGRPSRGYYEWAGE